MLVLVVIGILAVGLGVGLTYLMGNLIDWYYERDKEKWNGKPKN